MANTCKRKLKMSQDRNSCLGQKRLTWRSTKPRTCQPKLSAAHWRKGQEVTSLWRSAACFKSKFTDRICRRGVPDRVDKNKINKYSMTQGRIVAHKFRALMTSRWITTLSKRTSRLLKECFQKFQSKAMKILLTPCALNRLKRMSSWKKRKSARVAEACP